MQKIIAILLVGMLAAILPAPADAALDTLQGVHNTNSIVPQAVASGVTTGVAINVISGKGRGHMTTMVQNPQTNDDFYAKFQLQDSSTGTAGWTNVTAIATTALTGTNVPGASAWTKIDYNDVKSYVRVLVTISNATCAAGAAISFIQ